MKNDEITNLILSNLGCYTRIKKIKEFYLNSGSELEIKEFLYFFINDLEPFKSKCEVCDELTPFRGILRGFAPLCSKKCVSLSQERTAKIRSTTLLRYGVENYTQTSEYNLKSKETALLRYGKEYYTQTPEYLERRCKTVESQKIKKFETNNNIEVINYANIRDTATFRCNECGALFEKRISNSVNGQPIKCMICNPDTSTEHQIRTWINSYSAAERSRRIIEPQELDIWIPAHKTAVEYNGLMFHSSGYSEHSMFQDKPKKYHLEKTEACEKLGIQLFHIFENEWVNTQKQAIWKSVLLSKMHLTEKIPARKCVIREVSSKDSNAFLEENHLQGACNASIKVGLFFEEELVSLMTFGKPRFNKETQYELIRFCSKLNTTVQGAGSKLLKYFERSYSPESIVSYANRRWSEGNLYEKLGFDFVQNTEVNYFYFKPGSLILESRNKFQKHKLKSQLDIFDLSKTETENMFLNGYRRIFDSGNKVYFKTYK